MKSLIAAKIAEQLFPMLEDAYSEGITDFRLSMKGPKWAIVHPMGVDGTTIDIDWAAGKMIASSVSSTPFSVAAQDSIYNAMLEVEKLPANEKLTKAIVSLMLAKELVNEYVEQYIHPSNKLEQLIASVGLLSDEQIKQLRIKWAEMHKGGAQNT